MTYKYLQHRLRVFAPSLIGRAGVGLLACLLFLSSCRTDDPIIYATTYETGAEAVVSGNTAGMYVLCEGNMGSNKCTLDYLDLTTAQYHRNIYSAQNPTTVKELGDVGNDIKIYGSRLWMVINCSNKVEVAYAKDARRIGQVDIPNCRYLAFHKGFAYVSSFAGPVMGDESQVGVVYKVDTLSLKIVGRVEVGYQPEEMAIDRYGQLWVTSRGNYEEVPPRVYCLQQSSDGIAAVGDSLELSISEMCIVGDSLYYIGTQWSNELQRNTVSYGIINVRSHRMVADRLTDAPELNNIRMPYGLIVNPVDKDFYLMDAKNYVSSGELFHFKADGTFDWSVRTGDIPAHAVFVETSF